VNFSTAPPDIANILAHNARKKSRRNIRRAAVACSENEVASIPLDALMVLRSMYALAQHEARRRSSWPMS
jgi:hypothetical protein